MRYRLACDAAAREAGDVFSVGIAAFFVFEVHDEAECSHGADLRPQGAIAVRAWGQHNEIR